MKYKQFSGFPVAPLASPSGRWGQTLCPIDAQTAILIGGQGARTQFCKDPMWKLCTGQSVKNNIFKSVQAPVRIVSFGVLGIHVRVCSCLQQRTCPGLQQRLWQRVQHLRPGSATQPPTTLNQGGSLCLEAPKTRSGSMMFTSWTHRAGSGPWWRLVCVCVFTCLL